MRRYLEAKFVDAEPMTRGEYNRERSGKLPIKGNPNDPGYLVRYPDGRITWNLKTAFEKCSTPFVKSKNNTITQKDVDAFIKQIHVDEVKPNDLNSRVTIVTVTLANGFTLTESSTCIDPKNYNEEFGIDCCMKRINDKVWMLLSFLLSCGVKGFQQDINKPEPEVNYDNEIVEDLNGFIDAFQEDLFIYTELASPIMKFFEYEHLPASLQEISKLICKLAQDIDAQIPNNTEKTAGLRKLLEAKDCIERAVL